MHRIVKRAKLSNIEKKVQATRQKIEKKEGNVHEQYNIRLWIKWRKMSAFKRKQIATLGTYGRSIE